MTKKTLTCDQPGCKQTFTDPRALGTHKRQAHGIQGPTSTPEGKRRESRERHWRMKGYTGAKLEAMRAKYAAKEAAAPMEEPVRKQKKQTGAAEPMALTYCPYCDHRFYSTKGQ
jgi:hypothetical protein